MAENPRAARPERIGRYKVVDRIGRGAMGVVYSAHDEMMGRDVAVKVMMTDLEGEPDIRARFMREAQVSAKLAHRNIVTIFDVGEDNGRLFIVMELLRGETLDRALKQRAFSIEEKVDLTLEVCEGLAVASAAGVCHRDVKPGNLFVQSEGGLKILDFGIARLASSSMTASGFIVGTPDYMSPEQARGIAVDERSDIFSVGAVLYLMLTGRKPFVAPDLPAVLHKVVSEEPPPIDPTDAPPALARIVFKALAKDPNARFQKFPELSAELTRWRRRYDAETRALAERVAIAVESLRDFAAEEQLEAEPLGIPMQHDLKGRIAQIGAGFPQLIANGAASLRSGEWFRRDIEELDRRLGPAVAAWEQRIAELRTARAELKTGKELLERGDASGALASFERVLSQVPDAAIQPLFDRARSTAAEQQARNDRIRSLVTGATEARSQGRLDAALDLAMQALTLHPDHLEIRQFATRVRQELAAAEAERARLCERCLDRARKALQEEQFEEAERQLQFATQTRPNHLDIGVVRAALHEARAARQSADALVEEVGGQIALARGEFQNGDRALAIARLEALAARHPTSAALHIELERLRSESLRLGAAEQAQSDADRLAVEASEALEKGDAAAATRLADQALARVPSHESALRTSAVAHARLREAAERSARQQRAAELTANARLSLERGRFDRALKDARRAAELDPLGSAHAVIAEALRKQASAAAAEAQQQEAARRATEMNELLTAATAALGAKDFTRARTLAERALAVDPDHAAPKELIARIATRVAVLPLDDETVDMGAGAPDPDATAVLAPVVTDNTEGWVTRAISRVRGIFHSRLAKPEHTSGTSPGRDTTEKEA